jgi:DNA polymerase-3 subunit delta'
MTLAADDDAMDAGTTRAATVPLAWQHAMLTELLAQRARWPHATLITGRRGIGKRALANTLARALLCETPRVTGLPCGECPGCRYAMAGQHPDLRIVEPIDIADDVVKPVEWIVVDKVRALTGWAQLTSHRGGAKVGIVDPAERMNAAAANALLKTLEEPPAGTFLLLVSHQPGRLPATIRSRCQVVAAPQPTVAEGAAWLAAQGVRDANRVLAQAGGAPLAAIGLADDGYQTERSVWMKALAAPRDLSVTALGLRIDSGPRESRKERLAAAIDWLGDWCTDLARVRAGGKPMRNPDYGAQLATLAPSVAGVPLFRYHRSLLDQRALLAHPLQPRLVAEALLIDYRALFG